MNRIRRVIAKDRGQRVGLIGLLDKIRAEPGRRADMTPEVSKWSMPPILLALMLSLGSSVPEQNDLRIGIARVETPDARPSNPEFAITLEDRGDRDFVVVLGYMLGNGKRMFPDAITLLLTDSSGRASKLHFRPPVRIGSRIDDYTVALHRHASYVLRVSLAQYRSPYTGEGRTRPPVDGGLDPRLPVGTYTIQATFDGLAARSANSDMLGIRLMNFWTGTVSSNVLSFAVAPPSAGGSLASPEDRLTLIKALEHEAMLHRRRYVAARRGEDSPPIDDPELLPHLQVPWGNCTIPRPSLLSLPRWGAVSPRSDHWPHSESGRSQPFSLSRLRRRAAPDPSTRH